MKNSVWIVGLFLSVVCISSCNVAGGAKRDKTIAMIDAVGKLKFEQDKRQRYKKIAQTEGISPDAQVYLVKTVLNKLTFENAKEEVLLALIRNPSFSDSAEKAILNRLDKLSFESSKVSILNALGNRKAMDSAGG